MKSVVILGQTGCHRCRQVKEQCPNAVYLEPTMDKMLAIAKTVGMQTLPIVVMCGDVEELVKAIQE